MKAMKLTGIRRMEMIEMPEPSITDETDIKIRMNVVGVCGSDVHYYVSGRIGKQVVTYPFTVGHEGAGIVEAVGNKVNRVKPGDRVAIDPAIPCWECDQCKAGRPHTCRKLRFLGCPGQAEGCLAEYIVMPETSCFPFSSQVTPSHAALSEPLSIGVYAVKGSLLLQDSKVGILGSGPIGMSVMLAARMHHPGKIYMTDKVDERLLIAKNSGSEWTGNVGKENVARIIQEQEPDGLDVVFECCGQQEALEQAFDLLKPGGKLMIIGIPEFDMWKIPVDEARHKEICIQNVRRQVDCVQSALDYMESGRIKVDNMITHRFGFQDTKKAFDLVAGYHDGVMKAMIDI